MNHVYILGGLRSYIGVKDGMYRHIPAEKLGAEFSNDEVLRIEASGEGFHVVGEERIYDTKTVIIATGAHHRKLSVVGEEELTGMGDLCVKHGVTVVSDEIHNDFVFRGEHTVFASIKKEFEDICVVCTSPSKTFNLASMMISNIFVPNKELRQKFQHQV